MTGIVYCGMVNRRFTDEPLTPGGRATHLAFPYAITYTPSIMRTLSSTDLRQNLSSVMDQVNDDHEPVIVTRAKGKPVVMVSLEDWASMDETTYLLASPANRAMLLNSIAENDSGKVVTVTLAELEAMAKE
jgi:antitoxin YefM